MFRFPHLWTPEQTSAVVLLGLAALILFALSLLVDVLYFVVVPQWTIRRLRRTAPERLRRYLEWVVATPSPFGPASKLVARRGLVDIYLPQGRHAEAAAHCRAGLASLAAPWHVAKFAAMEADTRRRLADCLEAMGQPDEAEDERRRAAACVDRAPDDPLRHLTRGTLLEREHRYAEACEAFEQALALTPPTNRGMRVKCLSHLMIACDNAGRPAESLRCAEESIALGALGTHLRGAHRMASLACGKLGRLEESEDHCRRAYDVADAERDTNMMGQVLGYLAEIQRKRGKLAAADEACRKAGALDPGAVRMSLAVRSQVLRDWGRFDEALDLLRRHYETPGFVIPAHERRMRAACALEMSRIEAGCGRADDAWTHIQEAISVLGNDAKLGLNCEATAAWVLAARGLDDDSRRVAGLVEARLSEFEQDPSTCRGVLYDLGMAAWTRGDHETCEDCWTRYLGLSPDPVHRPTALYYRAECRRHRGDSAGAVAELREAVAMNIDSHHARLARGRLTESRLS